MPITISESAYGQLVALCAALLLLCAVLIVWRRSLGAQVRFLAVQGWALAGLVAVLGVEEESVELVGVAVLVAALKGVVLPRVLARTTAADRAAAREETPLINTTAALLAVSFLTMLAYLVSRPVLALGDTAAVAAVPVGVAMALFGFLVLSTRRHAVSQLIGFLLLDNGIATVAFLTAGGVPLVVELGVSLDVLLVVLILQVLTSRIRSEYGGADLDEMTELRD
jgi:hydrogenase-4 component E